MNVKIWVIIWCFLLMFKFGMVIGNRISLQRLPNSFNNIVRSKLRVSSSALNNYTSTVDSAKVKHVLKSLGFSGSVHTAQTSPQFHKLRKVENGSCDRIVPLVIARPKSSHDVSIAVKIARQLGIPLSLRSGGHSYTCGGIKSNSLHLDLRRLNKVQLLPPKRGKKHVSLVRLGPGSTWGRVLKIIPPERYTMVHGQCTTVGVGGYLAGGGVNFVGTTSRFGTGSSNILEYTLVTASGEILKVNKDNVTTVSGAGNQYKLRQVVTNNPKSNLFFSLKGAGSSYGVITEFLYKVYPVPETRPVLVPVFINGLKDIEKLRKFNEYRRFDISLFRLYTYRKIELSNEHLVNLFLAVSPKLGQRINFRDREPIGAMVVDLASNTGRTSTEDALAIFESLGIKIGFNNLLGSAGQALTIKILGFDFFDSSLTNYESRYLTQAQIREQGFRGTVSASFLLAKSALPAARVMFQDPVFGGKTNSFVKRDVIGCEWCYWTLIFYHGKKRPEFFANDKDETKGGYTFDLTCQFDPTDRPKKTQCVQYVNEIKADMNRIAFHQGEKLHQYYNTPSCNTLEKEAPFAQRYWGSNYGLLLRTKQKWDPDNTFNHCHSVGSTEQNCCVY